jgi:ABC-type long-subunit fatty acid transport system fused permease/ATPase subunit|tara:strand:+ start:4737 stop:4991 length:255 start_codon:yes stop_codon:yes gene_type:complete
MSEVKVLTEIEIENIKKVRENFQILVNNVGDVEIAIMNLNKRKRKFEKELEIIQEKENKIAIDLEKKYGKGNISLETGKFTPIE